MFDHLLFCDIPDLYRPRSGAQPASWQRILFDAQPDPASVRKLAEDQSQQSRTRTLVCNWLRQNQQAAPAKELFGVVIEAPLQGGLDVLAAYVDGSIRYINQTGKLTVFESAPENVGVQADRLLAASRVAITQIGPFGSDKIDRRFLARQGYFCSGLSARRSRPTSDENA